MFNVIDMVEGDKVDFWMLTKEPFDRSRFGRRYPEQVFGLQHQVSSPEDTILAKLLWCKLSGGSEKQFRDALRVYEVQARLLDLGYLAKWVTSARRPRSLGSNSGRSRIRINIPLDGES